MNTLYEMCCTDKVALNCLAGQAHLHDTGQGQRGSGAGNEAPHSHFQVSGQLPALIPRLGTPSTFCRPFEFPLGLGRTNTFLSASDMLLREPITKLDFPLGVLLAGLTQ